METLCNLDLKGNISDNLISCYKILIEKGWIGEEELKILETWIEEIC